MTFNPDDQKDRLAASRSSDWTKPTTNAAWKPPQAFLLLNATPTMNLRFRAGRLQQMWVNSDFSIEWRDVPEE